MDVYLTISVITTWFMSTVMLLFIIFMTDPLCSDVLFVISPFRFSLTLHSLHFYYQLGQVVSRIKHMYTFACNELIWRVLGSGVRFGSGKENYVIQISGLIPAGVKIAQPVD